MGTIHGFYSDFDGLSIILLFQRLYSQFCYRYDDVSGNDKRHLGDLASP